MLKFGIVSVFPPVSAALQRLRLAEQVEFDTFWICDSHVIWNETYSLLGWLVAQSKSDRLHFGTMVTNPVSRDPIVVASAFATVNQAMGDANRLMCGIGRGDSAVRVLNRRPGSVAATERAVSMIRALASTRAMEVDGTNVQLEWAHGRVPVYVAAYGPKMLQVAGRAADGVIIECADLHYIRWALEFVHLGAREAGRDPSELDVVISTTTYVSDDLAKARDEARPLGAVVGNHIAEVLRNNGPDSLPEELTAYIKDRPEYDYLKHVHAGADHSKYVPDDMVDRLCIVGSPADCEAKLRALEDIGVSHVNFYAETDAFDEHMRIYAQQIIPRLRQQVSA